MSIDKTIDIDDYNQIVRNQQKADILEYIYVLINNIKKSKLNSREKDLLISHFNIFKSAIQSDAKASSNTSSDEEVEEMN